MRAISLRDQFPGGALKCGVFEKGPQQFVMTGAGLMRAGEDGIDYPQSCRWTNFSSRYTITASQVTIFNRRGFECTHYCRSDCNHATAATACELDRFRRR